MSELSLTDNLVNTNDSVVQSPHSTDESSTDSKSAWQIALEKAPPNSNLIINYLPPLLTEEELHNLFSPYGMILYHKIIKDIEHDRSLGYGFVLFSTAEAAQKAVQSMNGYTIDDKKLKVSIARPASKELKRSNLYITSMPLSWTKDDMIEYFQRFGDVVEARILHDPNTQQFRGVGFCRLDTHQAALNAINELHNTIPRGGTEKLQVKLADIPSRYKSNNRRGGSGQHGHLGQGPHAFGGHPYGMGPGGHGHVAGNFQGNPAGHLHNNHYNKQRYHHQNHHHAQSNQSYSAGGPAGAMHHGFIQQQQQQQQQSMVSPYNSQYPYQSNQVNPGGQPSVYRHGSGGAGLYQQSQMTSQYNFPQNAHIHRGNGGSSSAGGSNGYQGSITPFMNTSPSLNHQMPLLATRNHPHQINNNGIYSSTNGMHPGHLSGTTGGLHTSAHSARGSAPGSASSGGIPTPHTHGVQHQGICLFVYHLPLDASDQTLYQIFSPYATVLSTKVMKDPKTGRSRGFGFVNVLSEQDGKYAISHLQNLRLGNKYIKISFKDQDDSATAANAPVQLN